MLYGWIPLPVILQHVHNVQPLLLYYTHVLSLVNQTGLHIVMVTNSHLI